MDGANSIWDIYSNAKKLLPLYDRMENRTLREDSTRVQKQRMQGFDIVMEDSDISLLTPLSNSVISSSPTYSKNTAQNNSTRSSSSAQGDVNGKSTSKASKVSNGKANGGNTNGSNMITPLSMSSESPNSVNNTTVSGFKTNSKRDEIVTDLSVADFLEFNNDSAFTAGLDFTILKELDKVNNNLDDDLDKFPFKPKVINAKSSPSVSSSNENVLSGKGNGSNDCRGISPKSTMKSFDNSAHNDRLDGQQGQANDVKIRGSQVSLHGRAAQLRHEGKSLTPPNLSSSAPAKSNFKSVSKCSNCGTTKTPLWRKDSQGNTLCNACGLFQKLHGTMRPLSLKTDVIKKRNSRRQSNARRNSSVQSSQQPNFAPSSAPQARATSTFRPSQFQFGIPPNATTVCNNSLGFPPQNFQFAATTSKQLFHQQQLPQELQLQQFEIQRQQQQQYASQRSKNVPILPKPSTHGFANSNTPIASSPTPGMTNSPGSMGVAFRYSATAQPQDIPQFKRRKSVVNLSSSHDSQPSSPMTSLSGSVGCSPSAYSPTMNAPSPTQGSIALSSISRQNSVSSLSSYGGIYQDISSKRGPPATNSGSFTNSYNGYGSFSNRNSLSGTNMTTNTNNTVPSGGYNISASIGSDSKDSSHFSNLSAGMNAIRLVNNHGSVPSNLSRSVINSSDTSGGRADDAANSTRSRHYNPDGSNMKINVDDLDWLKFDV
ncbi:hypothetical protein FOA43_000722 [Brettanomyces nanus]|uniref:GATA-type domain-containing protein n=1 Tax=Eeniella nana TaxID=13502 RepID=A0A875RZW4_EENNA|nr:uncharacterized protein FOA43_000722 [Brettanomyces nanus]QPG73412.1 hypothetical protein FOA43_000722 [Brettanomyces nanus]